MCGIAGIINLDKKRVELKTLQEMNNALIHRGPDDEGVFVEKNIGLGHRRLSIIDLSASGHQPMFYSERQRSTSSAYDNKNLVIVFNGEIYNYIEIKEELLKKGYKFKSQTDTEVILASYQEWGEKCLEKFNGMWAFAIWDKRKKLLFCARDRLGVKPFYYFQNRHKFVFASEIKAILVDPEIKAAPNEKIIWDYLISGLVEHTAETFFENIKELPGGHYLTINFKSQNPNLKIKKYWDVSLTRKTVFQNNNDYAKHFKELFSDSVKLRLRSDVPIGSCLSGGLDSSLIVCQVNDLLESKNKQHTFSACYNPEKYSGCDERPFVELVTQKTGAKSHYVFPSGKQLLKDIDDLVYHQDTPFASTSIYAQWNVFRLAKKHKTKVMLDGQGADELLAGYHGYFSVYFAKLAQEFKFFKLFSEVGFFINNHPRELQTQFSILAKGAIRGYLGTFMSNILQKTSNEYDLFKSEFKNKYSHPVLKKVSNDIFQNALYNLLKISLSSLLKYEDRDSMAFSIESRVPFLDYRLVEYIFSLPAEQKIHHGQTKWVLRQAAKDILPEKIRTRQDKIGFATPEEIWIKENLREDMRRVFSSTSFNNRGFFVKDKTLEKFNDFLEGKNKNYHLFWRLYNLEKWFRIFID